MPHRPMALAALPHRVLVVGALLLVLAVTSPTVAPVRAQEDPTAATGPSVTAADGTMARVDAIDPSNRVAGLLALYTPDAGASTGTNAFGAEAVLEATGTDGEYVVADVCTVFDDCPNPGDNVIPDDGYVLSASPPAAGGDDPRTFIRDHLAIGDTVIVDVPVLRSASRELDGTDPTAETNPDGVDPGTGDCFPGCRGTDQLLRYTAASGDRTGTNGFGSEITVVDGRVSVRGGNDSAIPQDGNGYVLSGHGGQGEWLVANSIEGALVTIDADTVTIDIDAQAYLLTAGTALDRAEAGRAAATASCLAVDVTTADDELARARADLDRAGAALAAGDEEEAVDLATVAQEAADRGWYATRESRPVEGRGTWIRPTEHTRAEVAATLDRVATAGLDVVFLESFYQGYTIFPSDAAAAHGVARQRPEFVGFDPLQAYVEEGAARGIEIHPWVHTFFVGSDAANGGPGPILEVHPDWAAVEREDIGADGPRPSSLEPGYYFLDPAVDEARAYVLEVFTELLAEYDVAGLHLDYIRYPVSLPLSASFSYSDTSRAAFMAEAGVDPATITPEDDPEQWAAFDEWRRGNVTGFVAEARAMVDGIRPDGVLSAAVFPDDFDSRVRKLQDWAAWSEAGLVDLLTGMSFGRSVPTAAADTASMLAALDDSTLLYTASYAPFADLPPDLLLGQVEAIREEGGQGAAVFAYNQLTDPQAAALGAGPFRDPAVPPHTDPVGATAVGVRDLVDRTEGRYAPGGCIDDRTADTLSRDLGRAASALDLAHREPPGRAGPAALDRADRLLAAAEDRLDADGVEAGLARRLSQELHQYRDLVAHARTR